RVPPTRVDRVFRRTAQPAEACDVAVLDARIVEAALETPLLELRVVPRFRHGANVDERIDPVTAQELDELANRPGRMPYRVHDSLSHRPRECSPRSRIGLDGLSGQTVRAV